jgi:hypothetical protein
MPAAKVKINGVWQYFSYGTVGATGATGAQGSQGTQGIQGIQGIQGVTGSKWYSGSGAPAGGSYVVGDWYQNTATSDIYEKTGASTWTYRFNNKGTSVAWYNTVGVPGTGVGVVGDMALNTTTSDVYQKTGVSTWTYQANIRGIQGIQGIQGVQGLDGSIWHSGTGAPTSGQYAQNHWYINDANGDVYEKTDSTTWVLRDNITGPQGIQGIQGDQGVQGIQGVQGPQGIQGIQGPQGTGLEVKGSDTYANIIAIGTPAIGDLWIQTDTGGGGAIGDGRLWDGSAWLNTGPIQGPQGPAGTPGPSAASGITTTGLDGNLNGISNVQAALDSYDNEVLTKVIISSTPPAAPSATPAAVWIWLDTS